jgi:hypothetical protein
MFLFSRFQCFDISGSLWFGEMAPIATAVAIFVDMILRRSSTGTFESGTATQYFIDLLECGSWIVPINVDQLRNQSSDRFFRRHRSGTRVVTHVILHGTRRFGNDGLFQ